MTDVQPSVDIEKNFFEEYQSLCFHLLTLVKHFRHVFHVLGVVSVDLVQGSVVFLFRSLNFLLGALHPFGQFTHLNDTSFYLVKNHIFLPFSLY